MVARWLEPLVSGLWIFFLVWSAWIACVWTFAIGDAALANGIGNRDLRAALAWMIGVGDIAWIVLAAANIHLWLAETEGLATARRWALIVGGGVAALAAVSVLTGFPLGAIRYSTQLGMKRGPVPVGLLLLWYAVILGARQTVLRCWPGAAHWQLALGTGALAVLVDMNLEPVAAKLRAFWFWSAASPAQPPAFTPAWTNYAAWFLTVSTLTFLLREERVAARKPIDSLRPVAIFIVLNAVFLAANLGRIWRR
ncbi:MAG: carotenoid biosynthesis protein [Chthoniobacter sp.]|nr:carotenoid biosynthesis protein [Chthoniobacter sp.]